MLKCILCEIIAGEYEARQQLALLQFFFNRKAPRSRKK